MSERVSFVDVGRAMRHAISVANAAHCTATQNRVLLAVIAEVCSYSRLTDRASLARVAATADIRGKRPEQEVARALKVLRQVGAAVYEPGCGRPGHGNGRLSLVGIPAAPSTEGAPTLRSDPKGGPSGDEKGGFGCNETGGRSALPPEKAPEKAPEKTTDVVVEDDLQALVIEFGLWDSQRKMVATAWREYADGVRRVAQEARDASRNRGSNATAVFVAKLKDGQHLRPEPPLRPKCPECGTGAGLHADDCSLAVAGRSAGEDPAPPTSCRGDDTRDVVMPPDTAAALRNLGLMKRMP